MAGIRSAMNVMPGRHESYDIGYVVLELRPQPIKGGLSNININNVLIKKGYFGLSSAGGGSEGCNYGWSGGGGASGAGFKGVIEIFKDIEIDIQVGSYQPKNSNNRKDTAFGNFIIAGGAQGGWDGAHPGYKGILTINNVAWARIVGTPEIASNGIDGSGSSAAGSASVIPGTNYGEGYYTGYLKLTYLGLKEPK